MFAYCGNNPVNHSDPNGYWFLDFVFLVEDVANFIANPSIENAGWVLLDVVDFADPTGAASATEHTLKAAHAMEKTIHAVDIGKESIKGGKIAVLDAIRGEDEVAHHMPQDAFNKTIGISRDDGPAILMSKEDHAKTRTFKGRGKRTMREDEELSPRQRMEKDIEDIRQLFGTKYDEHINQMLKYVKTLEGYEL